LKPLLFKFENKLAYYQNTWKESFRQARAKCRLFLMGLGTGCTHTCYFLSNVTLKAGEKNNLIPNIQFLGGLLAENAG
jgi:hypothetical protein